MWQKYDIESDQLKCNFCTQWFKSTLHYANLQRYSLKACHKCLKNFTYTILHPDTYKIYKVLLLDSNITISQPKRHGESTASEALVELEVIEQEVKDRLGLFFEQKIKDTIEEMKKANKRVEQSVFKMKNELLDKKIAQLQELRDYHQDLHRRINCIKDNPLDYWLNDPLPHPLPPKTTQLSKLSRNASGYLGSSRKSSRCGVQKQNFPPNREPFCKTIRNKVTGLNDSKVKLKSSHCLDLPPLYSERPKSLSKSSTNSKSRKRLDSSYMLSSVGNCEERDLNEIMKFLETNQEPISYLPFEVYHDKSAVIKNQSKRTQADTIIDLREKTSKGGELVELIGADTSKINFEAYLRSLGCQPEAKTLRIIKSGLSDYDFDSLLRFLAQHPSIQTLIVTNNRLTELSVMALHNFISFNRSSQLRNAYLGSNRINRERASGVWRELNQYGVDVCM